MGLQASIQTATATAAPPPGAGAVNTSFREFLAFKLGPEEYGIDIGDRMLILVDIEKFMSSEEMGLIEQTLQ